MQVTGEMVAIKKFKDSEGLCAYSLIGVLLYLHPSGGGLKHSLYLLICLPDP